MGCGGGGRKEGMMTIAIESIIFSDMRSNSGIPNQGPAVVLIEDFFIKKTRVLKARESMSVILGES